MTKRTLPNRATRGQLPSYLRETPSPVKKERVVSEQELLEARRKETENRLRLQQVTNLRKYPFSRVVHYFFDLDTFPRAKGHVSYAVYPHNVLNNTYSRDATPLGSSTYGHVLNRQLFGLPLTLHPELAIRK